MASPRPELGSTLLVELLPQPIVEVLHHRSARAWWKCRRSSAEGPLGAGRRCGRLAEELEHVPALRREVLDDVDELAAPVGQAIGEDGVELAGVLAARASHIWIGGAHRPPAGQDVVEVLAGVLAAGEEQRDRVAVAVATMPEVNMPVRVRYPVRTGDRRCPTVRATPHRGVVVMTDLALGRLSSRSTEAAPLPQASSGRAHWVAARTDAPRPRWRPRCDEQHATAVLARPTGVAAVGAYFPVPTARVPSREDLAHRSRIATSPIRRPSPPGVPARRCAPPRRGEAGSEVCHGDSPGRVLPGVELRMRDLHPLRSKIRANSVSTVAFAGALAAGAD